MQPIGAILPAAHTPKSASLLHVGHSAAPSSPRPHTQIQHTVRAAGPWRPAVRAGSGISRCQAKPRTPDRRVSPATSLGCACVASAAAIGASTVVLSSHRALEVASLADAARAQPPSAAAGRWGRHPKAARGAAIAGHCHPGTLGIATARRAQLL